MDGHGRDGNMQEALALAADMNGEPEESDPGQRQAEEEGMLQRRDGQQEDVNGDDGG